MNGSFNAIAQNLNVQRLYEKAFDQVMISPTPLWQFIVGQIIGGSLRGLYAGVVILVLTIPIGTGLVFNGYSFLIMFLNGAVFSTIGVVVSFYAKNHTDVPRFSNYIIMPMAYLCNTLFLYGADATWTAGSDRSTAIVPDQCHATHHCSRRKMWLYRCADSDYISGGVWRTGFCISL